MTAVAAPPRNRAPMRQAALAQATLGYAITGLGACIVLLADDLAVRPERLGWLPATFGLGLVAVALTGPLLLRGGPRPALLGGAAALTSGVTLLALAGGMPAAVAGALLAGAGGAAFVLVTPTLVTGATAAADLALASGAGSAAGVLAPPAIGAWAAAGPGSGRLALLLVVPPLLLLTVDALRTTAQHSGGSAPGTGSDPSAAISGAGVVRRVVARRWAVVVLGVSVEFCFTIWAATRLAATGLGTGTAALLATAFPVGMALGRLAAPSLIGRLPLLPAGAALTAASTLLVVLADGPALVTAGVVGAGLGVAALYPVALAGLVATPGLGAATAASLGALASGTAILAAPAALARLAEVLDVRTAYLITLPLLAALLLLHRRA